MELHTLMASDHLRADRQLTIQDMVSMVLRYVVPFITRHHDMDMGLDDLSNASGQCCSD
jgi:hypothetical protein